MFIFIILKNPNSFGPWKSPVWDGGHARWNQISKQHLNSVPNGCGRFGSEIQIQQERKSSPKLGGMQQRSNIHGFNFESYEIMDKRLVLYYKIFKTLTTRICCFDSAGKPGKREELPGCIKEHTEFIRSITSGTWWGNCTRVMMESTVKIAWLWNELSLLWFCDNYEDRLIRNILFGSVTGLLLSWGWHKVSRFPITSFPVLVHDEAF